MSHSLKKQLELLGLKGSEKKLYPPKKRSQTLQNKKSVDSATNQKKYSNTTKGNSHKSNPEDKILYGVIILFAEIITSIKFHFIH